MDISIVVAFAAAIFIAAIVARMFDRGPSDAAALASGIVLGNILWLTLVIAGLAAVARTFGTLFLVIRYAGAIYLLVLAYKLWNSAMPPQGMATRPTQGHPLRLVLDGLALEIGNPKTMVFYLALVPTIVDLRHVSLGTFAGLLATLMPVLGGVFATYIVLAARSRRQFRSPRALRAMNRIASAGSARAACAVAVHPWDLQPLSRRPGLRPCRKFYSDG